MCGGGEGTKTEGDWSLTGPALLFLAGCELADGAGVAVQAALHADEAKAAGSVLRWWCVRLVVVTASDHGQRLNERRALYLYSTYMATTEPFPLLKTPGSLQGGGK